MAQIAAIVGRILIAALFVFAGFGKIMDPAGTAQYMEAMSPFPGNLAMAVGIFEVVAGLILATGFMARLVSAVLIGFTLLATLFFHRAVTDPMQATMALKNLAIVGGLLMVFAYGHVRGRIGLMDEREKRYDAEVRAAHAEGRAEALAAAPVAAAPVAAAPVAAPVAGGPTGVPDTHQRTVADRDGDGINDVTGRDAPGTHRRTITDRDGDGHIG